MKLVRGLNELEEKDPNLSEFREEFKKIMERTIKANRDIIILSALLNRQMCGYDLIKEIFSSSDVFLSQGTVYPILYSLEDEGLLRAEFSRGDMRTKKYSLTPKGREIADIRRSEFVKAMEHIAVMMKR